jgi:hypothetical protein
MFVDCLLVELWRLTFYNGYGVLWTVAKAGSKPIAVGVFHYPGFAVYDLERALCAVGDALAAAVALLFVYVDDVSLNHDTHL